MKYSRIRQAIGERPWAMRQAELDAMLEIIELRAAGVPFSEQESGELIAAARAAREEVEASAQSAARSAGGSIAILPLFGVLIPRATTMSQLSGGTSLEAWGQKFDELVANSAVQQILLLVDSPGGSADLVAETAAKVAASKKPVVALASTMAASAAYWIASQAAEFDVTTSGEVGSIGVVAVHDDVSQMNEKLGVKPTYVTAGKFKAEFNQDSPLSEDAEAELQRRVDDVYDMFTADVAKGRRVTKAMASGPEFGQGRMLEAKRAVAHGMADRVSTLEQTLERMGERKASIRGRKRAELPAAGQTAEIASSLRQAAATVKEIS